MINFRFHIVSLTAVLLALAMGLLLGTTFLDDATEDVLRNRLASLEAQFHNADQRNAELQDQLDSFEREAEGLDGELGQRLFDGQLAAAPVLVVAPQGLEGDPVERVLSALEQADADVAGVWRLTDRFTLDDGQEVADLAAVLGVDTEDAERLRRSVATQLAETIYGAGDASGSEDVAPQSLVGEGAPVAGEPAMLARLREAGFVEYELPEGNDGDTVLLPLWGLRTVVVSGPGAVLEASELVMPMLRNLASAGPVATVVAEPTPVPETGSDEDAEGEPTMVQLIRNDEDLRERLSTVDDLERVAGRVATVLALADAAPGSLRIGHYGLADGADLLLPSADGE